MTARFLSRIALAASLLTAGPASAEDVQDTTAKPAGPVYRKEFQWGLYCDREPVDAAGKPVTTAVSEVPVVSDSGEEIAKLRIETKATLFPPHATVLTAEEAGEAAQGIPAAKVVLSQDFSQTGHLTYTAAKQAKSTGKPAAADLRIPDTGEAATRKVNCTLPFFKLATAPWTIGETPPAAPEAPGITFTPPADMELNQVAHNGGMAYLASWSDQGGADPGWTWTGVYHLPSGVGMLRDMLSAWKPAAGEAKTGDATLLWSMKRCVRSRLVMQGAKPGGYKPVNPANEGWSEWKPD